MRRKINGSTAATVPVANTTPLPLVRHPPHSTPIGGLTARSLGLFCYKNAHNIIMEHQKNREPVMKLKLAFLVATALIAAPSFAAAQEKGGVINVATIGEPPTLDPMASTADLVGIVTQHIFETLYTFD